MAGRAAFDGAWRVRGVSVSRARELQEEKVHQLSNNVLGWLGMETHVEHSDIDVEDRFTGGGYGVPTPATWEAIQLLARVEGVVLDPVYTGKAMAGFLDHVRSGLVPAGSTVVFVHTGGAPALFGYASEAVEAMALV